MRKKKIPTSQAINKKGFPSAVKHLIFILALAVPLFSQSKWEWSVPSQGGNLSKIAYGNNRFVAIGTRTISVSLDEGAHWSSTIPEPITDLHSIAFGAGVFVVVGNNGLFLSSSDGVNWTTQTLTDTLDFWSVAFGNNTFVALGLGDERTDSYTSQDGATWKKSAHLWDFFSSMVFGNGIFMCVAISSNHPAYSSVDGATWKKVSNVANYAGLTFIHNRFFARWRIEGVGGFMWSDDGESWNQIKTKYDDLISLTGWYDNGQYYLYPLADTVVLTSPDCSTWTSQSVGTFRNPIAIVSSPANIIALTPYGGIYASPDGISWTQQAAGTIPRQLISVAYGNGRFVAVDKNARQTSGERWQFLIHSPDGKTWTAAEGDFDVRYMHTVVFVNNRFIVTGAKGKILTSVDGIYWTQIQTPDTTDLFMCAYGDGKYVVTAGTGKFYVSGDLTTWKYNYVNLMGGVDGMFPINNRFVLCQNNRYAVRFTDDGEPERTVLPELLFLVSSIAYGNGRYIGVGSEKIISSVDGINWVSEDSTTPFKFHNLMFCNNHFVAIVSRWAWAVSNGIYTGTDQAIGTSPDGVHWTLHNTGISNALFAMAYGDGKFVAVGADGAILVSRADDPNQVITINSKKGDQCTMSIRQHCLTIQSPLLTTNAFYMVNLLNVSGRKTVSRRVQAFDSGLRITLVDLSAGMYLATVSENSQVKTTGRVIFAR